MLGGGAGVARNSVVLASFPSPTELSLPSLPWLHKQKQTLFFSFKRTNLFSVFEYLPVCLYLYHELDEARRGYGIPWNGSLHVGWL